jgi:tetratricopeptide (TPR) repeat protein
MFALAAVASIATFLAQSATGNIALGARIGFGSRLANAIESYWNYLCDAIWPAGLAPLYPHPYALAPVSNQAAIAAAGLGVALIGLTVFVLMASRKRAYLGVGWLWYLGTLVPMIGLAQVGLQARADRYMYLPLVGLSIALAWGLGELAAARRRKPIAALAGAALIALAIVTRLQLDHWENSIALFERAVATTERNHYAHERLAFELLQVDRPEEARDHYRAAIAIKPWYAPLYYGLALSFEDSGDNDAALAAYRNALRRQPDMVLAHGSLGLLLVQVGRHVEAKRHLLVATRAMPDSIEYREALAVAMSELDRSESGDP